MTPWLVDSPTPEAAWAELTALAPAGMAAFVDVQQAVWDLVDPRLLELCRLRMARLLGATSIEATRSDRARQLGLGEAKISALSSWPTSPLFDEAERACLALCEQYLVDVNGITDREVEAVLAHLSAAECYAFVSALWAFEQFQRMSLVLGVGPPPWAAGLTKQPDGENEETQ